MYSGLNDALRNAVSNKYHRIPEYDFEPSNSIAASPRAELRGSEL